MLASEAAIDFVGSKFGLSIMMQKKGHYFLVTIIWICTIWNFTAVCSAQTDEPSEKKDLARFEIGAQVSWLRRTDANTSLETFRRFGFPSPGDNPDAISELGIGGRFTINLSKIIGLEAEVNFFPQDKQSPSTVGTPLTVIEPGGRKLQALAGPKIGMRKKAFGVFGKVRPGILWLDRYNAVIGVGTPKNFYVLGERRENVGFFNIDIGGVFEYYPSRRTVFRVDIGDTIIHYRKLPPKEINPSITRHNLQISTGLGFRF